MLTFSTGWTVLCVLDSNSTSPCFNVCFIFFAPSPLWTSCWCSVLLVMYRDSVETPPSSPAEHKYKRFGSRCFQWEASSTSLLVSYQLLKISKTELWFFFKVHGIMFEGISWKMKPSSPLQASECESSSAKVTITSTHSVCVCVRVHRSWVCICMNACARPPRPHKHASGLCLITCQMSEAQRAEGTGFTLMWSMWR